MSKPVPPNQGVAGSPAAGRRRLWLGLALAVLLATFWLAAGQYLSLATIRERYGEFQTLAGTRPWLAGLIYVGVYAALAAASVPVGTALILLGGAVFGVWIATALASVAAAAGATGAMLISRFLLRDWVARRFGSQMEPIQQRIETDGKYYLFALRLTPVVPSFLVNLASGPTRLAVWTFAWVTWGGMLPMIWLYANAGTALSTIESLSDLLSPTVVVAFTLLGLAPLAIRFLLKVPPRKALAVAGCLAGVLFVAVIVAGWLRYRVSDSMELDVRELSNADYPEDPSLRSLRYGQYNGRKLTLSKRSDTEFDLAFESTNPHVARVVFKNVDLRLFVPNRPKWVAEHPGLEAIALSQRQWNRQQVRFGGAASPNLEISGGDGYEQRNLFSAELASSGLNAGLWEVLLFAQEQGSKVLYYHGWFSIPLGHYWNSLQHETGLSFWSNVAKLEFNNPPVGVHVKLDELRTVTREEETRCSFDPAEPIFARGEQTERRRIVHAENVLTWKDFSDGRPVKFASFVAPGRFDLSRLHGNEFTRIDRFHRALVREIRSPADEEVRNEIELVFESSKAPGKCRFVVSGFRWDRLPALNVDTYERGLSMPMGIGVPPVHQDYKVLASFPAHQSPYFCMFLDDTGAWLDNHRLGVDGPILHRDAQNPDRVHLYLTSYGRETLVGHWVIERSQAVAAREMGGRYYR